MTRLLCVTAACIVGPASALLIAGEPQTVNRYSGSADFQVYCASCHGTEARGDGVLASMLKKRPSDLTLLTTRNEGVFPAEAVFKTIDEGREHADMPAWAQVFAKAQESAGPGAAKERIAALVKYLQSVQHKEK